MAEDEVKNHMNTKLLTVLSRLYFACNTPVNRFEIETDVNLAYASFQRRGEQAEKQIFSQLARENGVWVSEENPKENRPPQKTAALNNKDCLS